MVEFKLSLNEDVAIMPVLPHMPIPLNLWHPWGIGRAIETNILPGKMLLNEVKAIIKYLIISGVGIEGYLCQCSRSSHILCLESSHKTSGYVVWLYAIMMAYICRTNCRPWI